jgi:hypothetical protein
MNENKKQGRRISGNDDGKFKLHFIESIESETC